jgi:hypothetical protein
VRCVVQVASATLTTVPNSWYEVEGGIEVRVTCVYLSRAWRWEEALPEEVQRELVPESPGASRDMAKLRLSGEYLLRLIILLATVQLLCTGT